MARFFVGDPYASAFNPLPRDQMGDPSLYDECPRTLECRNCTCADCAPSCSAYSYQVGPTLQSTSNCATIHL